MNQHVVVVGSGVAGLSAALTAAEQGAQVELLCAGPLLSGSSDRAQGGVAAALDITDAPARHRDDTLQVGGELNDVEAVEILVRAGQRQVQQLLDDGVPFTGGAEHPDLGLEAGHSRRRILHAGGGATGHALTLFLAERALAHPRIHLHEQTQVDDLLVTEGVVSGVRVAGERLFADAIVLATGGYASLWNGSTNAAETRGSGVLLAWRAGASLADLEFVQFHPTVLALPGCPPFLLSEALRGEGARLVGYAEEGEGDVVLDPLLPRDVLARAIFRYEREQGPVYLSLRHLNPRRIRDEFSALVTQLAAWKLDLTSMDLPVQPGAHYCMGGVRTDTWGRTDVRGLFVAGEAACTGVQGANRLASNSLLECLVFGARAGQSALTATAPARWTLSALPTPTILPRGHGTLTSIDLGKHLQTALGVEREEGSLRTLLEALPDPLQEDAPADLLLASLSARSALLRDESRGAHYRTDAPTMQPRWRGHLHWRRGAPPQFEEVH